MNITTDVGMMRVVREQLQGQQRTETCWWIGAHASELCKPDFLPRKAACPPPHFDV